MSGCVVTEIAMVSSLGHGTANACAAARAGLTRQAPLDVKNFVEEAKWDGGPILGHCIPAVGRGFVSKGKAVLVGTYALRNLLRALSNRRVDPARTKFFLLLTDRAVLQQAHALRVGNGGVPQDGTAVVWKQQGQAVLASILEGAGAGGSPAIQVAFGEHAEIVPVLQAAVSALRERRFDACIVGAVDSTVEPSYLDAASDLLMLRTPKYPVGFVPGEAGAFMLLQREEDSDARRGGARISGLATASDPRSYLLPEKPIGIGLAEVVRTACVAGRTPLPGAVISDMNGWEARSVDWANALLRLKPDFDLSGTPLWLPAMSFGETGAAAGLVAIATAWSAFQRGYMPGSDCLICLASSTGGRGAIRLEGRN